MTWIIRHPRLVIIITLLITLFFGLQLPRAELDNNNFRFIPHDDPERRTLDHIDDTFESTNYILVGLEQKTGTVFEPDFLNLLAGYIAWIETIDIVEKTNSLINATYIYGEDDAIIVERIAAFAEEAGTAGADAVGAFFDDRLPPDVIPEAYFDAERAERLRARALSWDFYTRTLVSDDLRAAQVIVTLNVPPELEGDPSVSAGYLRIRDIALEVFGGTADVYVTGLPVISATINESVKRDLALLLPLVIAVVLIVMYLPLKSVRGVLYALLPVLVSVICAMGAMPLFGVKLTIISTVIPVVLVAVGNSYGLHVVVYYLNGLLSEGKGRLYSLEERRGFALAVMKKVRAPILLAALTTWVSFLAFCWTKVLPIREFGIFSAFGVLAAFITSVTFLPAVLVLAPLSAKRTPESTRGHETIKKKRPFFMRLAVFIADKKIALFAVGIVVIGISAASASRLIVDNIFIEYFRNSAAIVKSDAFIRQKFGGSKVVNVMLEAESSDIILHPDTLGFLDGLNVHLKASTPLAGNIMSFTDFIKRINAVFYGGGGENYDEIPALPERYGKADKEELRGLIANYLFFLADIGGAYADDPFEPHAVRSVVQLATVGEKDSSVVINEIRRYIKDNLPENITAVVGGTAQAEAATNRLVVESVWTSMVIATICLFIIVALVNKSFVLGFAGVLPLFSVIIINFAVMGFFGIKLNIGTAMIFSLTMGIGIDYTIHVMEALKHAAKNRLAGTGKDSRGITADDLVLSYRTSGVAIITDAVSTGFGFAVLLFSRFVMLAEFGALVSISLLISAIVGLVFIPALLFALHRS